MKTVINNFQNQKYYHHQMPCSRRGVTGLQCNSVYTRGTPEAHPRFKRQLAINKKPQTKILLNGSCMTLLSLPLLSMPCDYQPIRFLQHVMWPSTNQIPTACHMTFDQSCSFSMHVTFDQSSAASLSQPQLLWLAVIVCTVNKESCGCESSENKCTWPITLLLQLYHNHHTPR